VGDAGIVPAGAVVTTGPERPEWRRPKLTGEGRLPGDLEPRELVHRMIRVDHAGELGAVRIYDGQLAVLGRAPAGDVIRRMAAQERRHLEAFERLIVERRVRPTLLSPLWHAVGYALGAGTALMGERAAMACTVAIEEVIDGHYRRQVEQLGADEAALGSVLESFQADEQQHRDEALALGAEAAPGYALLSATVKAGSRLAIWLSERL
jgi:ubiquinone biosynthesis monooxygenase Coq7